MPSISENMMAMWRNYHLTEQGRYVPVLATDPDYARVLSPGRYPDGTVRDTASINCSDLAGEPALRCSPPRPARFRPILPAC
jgi:hypothetical protein